MKFISSCETIRKEIELAVSFTSIKNSLSVTSNVLLENQNDTLTIKAQDGKVSFISTIPVTTVVPGSTTVFCSNLNDVLKNLPDEDMEFSEEEEKLNIRPVSSNKINTKLKTMDASKFPEIKECVDEDYFSLPQKAFNDMAEKTSFAVAEETTRYFLTGVRIEKKDEKVVMVATDGRRLAYCENIFEQEVPDFLPAILPVKFLQLLERISTNEGLFSLAITADTVYAKVGDRTISSTLINGNYPNYERVIPSNLEYECKLSVEEMVKSITLTSIFTESKSKKIFVDINVEGVMISGENNEVGDSKQIIQCEYNGPSMKISFNSGLLLPAIKKIDTEFLKIRLQTQNGAMIFSPEPEKNYFYVLMPMQG